VAEENIIEICRREAQTWIDVGIGDGWPLTQAADLLEAQQAEVERLRVDIEAIHENALVNIERLRAERDAERSLADWLAHALADHMRGEDHPAYTEWEARRG
jgi:hypothetical protein